MNSTDIIFQCVNGGTWFVCSEEPHFIGCCLSDPCANATGQGCPIEDLYSASFYPKDAFSLIGKNGCLDSSDGLTLWYTCQETNPTFLGCCKSNPCSLNQCPSGQLRPAVWVDQQQEQLFDGSAAITSTSSSSATSPVQATTSFSITTSAGDSISTSSSLVQATTPSSITTSTGDSSSTTIQPSNNGSGISTSAIVGIGIAAFFVIVVLIAVLMFKCGWDARKKRGGRGTMTRGSSLMTADYMKSSLSPDRDPHASSIMSRSPQNWNAFDPADINSYHFPSRPYPSPTIAGETYGTTEPRVDRYRDSVRAHGLYTGGLPPDLQELDAIEQQLPAELSEPYMGDPSTHKC